MSDSAPSASMVETMLRDTGFPWYDYGETCRLVMDKGIDLRVLSTDEVLEHLDHGERVFGAIDLE